MKPVRVRGKKYRKKPTASAQVPRVDGRASLPNTPTRLKRSNSELGSSSGSRKRGRIQDDASVTQPAEVLSTLERLPVEVLEPIFLQSLNLSLPRASYVLGRKLASKHVKSNLFMTVFPSKHRELINKAFLLEILGSTKAIGSLQSQILALKWMTPDFLESMLEEYTARTIVRLFKEYGLGWVDLERTLHLNESHMSAHFDVSTASKEVSIEVVRNFYKQHASRLSSDGPLETWQQLTWWNESVSKEVKMRINFREGHLSMTVCNIPASEASIILDHQSSALCCYSGCRIPHKLLHGPWSITKCVHLERVFRGGAKLDFSGATTDEEVAARGLRDAVTEDNVRAMHDLIGRAGIRECKLMGKDGRSCFFPERAEVFGRMCVGVVVTTELFKFVLAKDCSLFVLGSFADAINIRVNWKDKAITSWAIKKRNEGDERGQWLYDRLDDAGIDLFRLTKE